MWCRTAVAAPTSLPVVAARGRVEEQCHEKHEPLQGRLAVDQPCEAGEPGPLSASTGLSIELVLRVASLFAATSRCKGR
jgi:hypothetical protein